MYPFEPVLQPTRAASPSLWRMRARLRTRNGHAAALSLMAVLLLALSGCSSSSSGGASTASNGPTQTTQVTQATQTPIATTTPKSTPPVLRPTATATPHALVSPSIHEVAQTTSLKGTSTGPATVTCPQGEVALGGGWSVPAQGNRVFAAMVNGNTWSVSVEHSGAVIDLRVTAYVECLAGAKGAAVTRRAVSSTAQPNSTGTVNAAAAYCNQGESPVGFGFDFSASPANLELMATNPTTFEEGVWWNFAVFNHDSVARAITLYVNCLSNVNARPSYLVGQQGGYIYAGGSETVSVSCPSGTVPAGGGLDYTAKSTGNLYLLHATSNEWQGAIYGVSGNGLIPLIPRAHAVCLSFS